MGESRILHLLPGIKGNRKSLEFGVEFFFTPAHFKRIFPNMDIGHILKSVIKSNLAFIIVKGKLSRSNLSEFMIY